MTWRRATDHDLPQIEDFLSKHPDQTMFARANLASDGFETEAPRAMRFWWDGVNIIGRTNTGLCFPMGHSNPDWRAARTALHGETISGFLGPAHWAAGFVEAIGLQDAPTEHLAKEPHFALRLDELSVPDCEGFSLSPIPEEQRAMAIEWRAAYAMETLGTTAEDAPAAAARAIADYIARDSHRLLWHGGQPVATTGFNAEAGDCVQIGGVYTPPELRGRGYARRAVALHLQEAHRGGAKRSVLTAANERAARAYVAIGFRQIGEFAFHFFRDHQVI